MLGCYRRIRKCRGVQNGSILRNVLNDVFLIRIKTCVFVIEARLARRMVLDPLDQRVALVLCFSEFLYERLWYHPNGVVRDDVHAITDVTGFGLLGHVYEMAQGGGVRIVIEASRVPLMARTLEFARKGLLTRAHVSTREHLGEDLTIDAEVEETLGKVLLDAQTSGGLLLSVTAERCDELVSELKEAGALCAVVVGRVEDGDGCVRLSA